MTDAECVQLLQWAAPRLELRFAGFRNVRGQVCKRIARRVAELGLSDIAAYRERLEHDAAEWKVLDGLCVVTISRFYRDRHVWDALRDEVLPTLARAALAAHERELCCWSIGCASGEEPYTLAIVWLLDVAQRFPGLALRVLATDVDARVLARARSAEYIAGTLRDLPNEWIAQAFERRGDVLRLRRRFRAPVELLEHDVRLDVPDETFRLMLCRNIVFSYFDEALQRATLERLSTRLARGGAFLLGAHEKLPSGAPLEPWHAELGIHRHVCT